MKRTRIEQLLLVIAWMGLIGGILFTILVCKGTLESNFDMRVPEAIVTFAGGVFVSVAGWALLMQVIRLSDRIRKIEDQLKKSKD